uniref:Uncharacterized protein n=1 Tax=Anguilla anguilla TaxID=7936 RepID=A0A0E9XES7_ANGAN
MHASLLAEIQMCSKSICMSEPQSPPVNYRFLHL